MYDSYQPAKLQRLADIFKFCMLQVCLYYFAFRMSATIRESDQGSGVCKEHYA